MFVITLCFDSIWLGVCHEAFETGDDWGALLRFNGSAAYRRGRCVFSGDTQLLRIGWTGNGNRRAHSPDQVRINVQIGEGFELATACTPITDYEAQGLIPFIGNGPLTSWMYPVFGIHGASWFLGVSEWVIAALLLVLVLSARSRPVEVAQG